jgi:hypothetical protein
MSIHFCGLRSYPEKIFFLGTGWNQFGQSLAQRIHEVIGNPLVKFEVA